MSPPEVWGPAVWKLFHTLTERIHESAYQRIYMQLFFHIQRICNFLPCPDCANDATKFLSRIHQADIDSKIKLKNIIYLFHNYVNVKKRKPLFNYANMNIYGKLKMISVINNFIIHYNTKGNMKLLAESFQRQLVVKDFKSWLSNNMNAFTIVIEIPENVVSYIKEEELIDNKEEELIDNKEEELIDNKEEELIDNKEEELIDHKEEELIDHKEEELIDHKEEVVNEPIIETLDVKQFVSEEQEVTEIINQPEEVINQEEVTEAVFNVSSKKKRKNKNSY